MVFAESLFPIYEVQVRAYAAMAKEADLKPLNSLLLIYLEPPSRRMMMTSKTRLFLFIKY